MDGEQNTVWTTLGIPATPSASGLQRMSQSSANPLVLQWHEISSQSRWQCPIPPHIPTFAPTLSSISEPAYVSSVPLPVSVLIPAAPNCLTVPFSSSGYDIVRRLASCSWTSAGNLVTELVAAPAISDKEYLVHRTVVQKPLAKVATMKQLEVLGHWICQQGLESVKQPKKPEFSHVDISASLECPNMDSGIQRHLSSLVVEDLWKTPQAAACELRIGMCEPRCRNSTSLT
jgi:hypothetical protein